MLNWVNLTTFNKIRRTTHLIYLQFSLHTTNVILYRPIYSTVVYFLVTWPMTASKAEGDLALIKLLFWLLSSCKCKLVNIRTWLTQQNQWGLHQNKMMITSSLAAIQRPGHLTDNCKNGLLRHISVSSKWTLFLQFKRTLVFLLKYMY